MIRRSFAAFSLLLFVSSLAASTAAQQLTNVASVTASPGLMEWTPVIESEGITLTIADPQGLARTIQFAPGEAPALSLFDTQGAPLPDGTYTWELRATPRLGADRNLLAAPLVQSGHFTIRNGDLVPPGLPEQPESPSQRGNSPVPRTVTAPDHVVPDDLIVDGKGCIGLSCVNSEAFGAEALRLKQSVVRLRFEDTSAAGFPARDWQLTVNDSTSGGADRFSLEDLTAGTTPLTVRGGAPSNSLYIDPLGQIGIGTAAPTGLFHIFGTATADSYIGMGMNIVSGPAFNFGYSGASFGRSSGFFNIRPDPQAVAPNPSLRFMTANLLRMIVTNVGDIGVGTAAPAARLDVRTSASGLAVAKLQNSSATGYSAIEYLDNSGNVDLFFGIDNITSTTRLNSVNNNPIVILTNSTERIRFPSPGGNFITAANGASLTAGGIWTNASSRDFKEDVVNLDASEALTAIKKLDPVKFQYKSEPGEQYLGFIAEDVPELVARNDRKSLSPMDVVAVLTKVVQEQQKTIEDLSASLGELRAKLDAIEGNPKPSAEPPR